MKMILGILFAAAIMFGVPAAQAQHGGHSSGGHSTGGHSSGHSSGGQRTGTQHSNGNKGSVKGGQNRGHFDVNHGRLRDDHEREHFGREHQYRGGDFRWYGRPYGIGSRFFIGGFWFDVNSVWFFEGTDYPFVNYYVEWDDTDSVYYLYSPQYIGRRVIVSVVF